MAGEGYTRVVVPLDGSDAALDAVPIGARLARLHDCELWLLTVATPLSPDSTIRRILDVGREVSEVPESRTTVLYGDDPATELARFDREHTDALLCMTTKGRTSLGRAMFGSVTRQVVTGSDQAQVLVGPRCESSDAAPIEALVVCLDGSKDAESVLRWGEMWNTSTDLALVLVHIVYPLPPPEARIAPSEQQLAPFRYLKRVASALRKDGHRVDDLIIQHSDTPEAILDVAAKHPHGLLAVATGHPSPLGEMVVGSTAARLLRSSPIPVLVASRSGAAEPVPLI